MKKLKRAYFYLFYTFYKWYESSYFVWASDWKAGISVMLIEVWLVLSIVIYYNVLIDRYFQLDRDVFMSLVFAIVIINTKIFTFSDEWKKYVREFDKLPKNINRKWRIITWGVVFLLIINLIFSFYLMSLIDWSQYR